MSFARRTYGVVLGLALVAARMPALAAAKDSVPEWVRTAMAQPAGKYPAETSAVVLLDETTLTVGTDGRAMEHHRHVVKILRPKGRADALVEIPYDKESKILSLHVWSVGPDGHEYAMKDSEIEDRGSYGGETLFSENRYKVARAPGSDPGGVIAYEYERRDRPYEQERTWFFQDDVPHVSQSFTLELPPNYIYETSWSHVDKAKAATSKAIDLEHQRYRWERNEEPAIDLEQVPMHPAAEALAERMTVHYGPAGGPALNSWQQIGVWYDLLSRERLMASPEIAAKAAELTAGKTDFYEKAETIGEFVQKQIRYVAIELGIGGYQPHAAADVFHNRYGDCKDKATLLSAMLSSVGIHSALMMVDTERGVVDPEAPSLTGNHMIGAIEIPKGYASAKLRSVITTKAGRRYLIFDPTWEMTAFGQLEHNLQGGYGVLMEGKGTEIAELPVLSPEFNTVQRSGTLQLQADGGLKGSIVEKRFGDVSERNRELYATGDEKQQKTVMDHRLSEDFTAFHYTDLKVENVSALSKDLTTSYQLSAERFGRAMGPLLMVRPRVLGSDELPVDRKVRNVPIDLRETMTAKDDFTIELPEGYAVDEMPAPVKLDVGFASYESSSRLDGNSLHYTRTYTVRQVTLPASRNADFQKLAETIGADEQNHAILKKKQ